MQTNYDNMNNINLLKKEIELKKLAYFTLLIAAIGILFLGCEKITNPDEALHSDQSNITLSKSFGSKLAFQRGPQFGTKNIFVMNPDGSEQTQITFNEGHNGYPSWSPNGKKIAFEIQPLNEGGLEIFVMNADGSEQTQLTYNVILENERESYDGDPDWSPNGKKIAFGSNRTGAFEIYVMNADGSEQTQITFGEGGEWFGTPMWSPNGKKILFQNNFEGDYNIYVMDADGSGITQLTDDIAVDRYASWSPNGKKIAFISNRDLNYEVYVMNSDGSEQTRLTVTPANEFNNPTWSPDGKKLAFDTKRDGEYQIYTMNVDGSGEINISNNEYRDFAADWSNGTLKK